MHALVHDFVTCRASVPLRKVSSSQISFFGLVLTYSTFPVTYFLFCANVVGVTDGVSSHVFVTSIYRTPEECTLCTTNVSSSNVS